MFCVIYQWKVKPGMTDKFRAAWRGVSEQILQHYGSLGSRLHATEDETCWVSYAQWPSRESWEAHQRSKRVIDASSLIECLEQEPIVLWTLTTTDDLLKQASQSKI